jgi:hypothetical protein
MGIRGTKAVKTLAALGALAFAAWAGPAGAVELVTPYLPGNSVGAPAGASPPPGLYGVNTVDLLQGPIVDNNGNNIPGVRVSVALEIPVLVYVPNFKVLGATYNVALIIPYAQQTVMVGGAGGTPSASFNSNGMFNTIIVPVNLSWMVAPGLFVSTGLGIYVPDGTYASNPVYNGHQYLGREIAGTSIANNTWTFEPDVAVSYLADGWNLTGKVIFDLQTTNPDTNYSSGAVFFFDWTAAHKFGKWEAGVGGTFIQQISADSGGYQGQFGPNSNGHEYSYIALGPVVSYDFGPVTLQSKLLLPAEATNGGKITQFYMTAIWGF